MTNLCIAPASRTFQQTLTPPALPWPVRLPDAASVVPLLSPSTIILSFLLTMFIASSPMSRMRGCANQLTQQSRLKRSFQSKMSEKRQMTVACLHQAPNGMTHWPLLKSKKINPSQISSQSTQSNMASTNTSRRKSLAPTEDDMDMTTPFLDARTLRATSQLQHPDLWPDDPNMQAKCKKPM